MAQITHGLRAILSSPEVYSLFQRLVGAERFRRRLVAEDLPKMPGMRVLDIGCGPADLLAHLPADCDYVGFDASPAYIAQARRRFGSRGRFEARWVNEAAVEQLAPFDVVLALGLLHHLDDDEAIRLFQLAWEALKPGGVCIAVDPVWHRGQHPVARWIIARDRGCNVRDQAGYQVLATRVFQDVACECRQNMLWIPYSHLVLRARKPK